MPLSHHDYGHGAIRKAATHAREQFIRSANRRLVELDYNIALLDSRQVGRTILIDSVQAHAKDFAGWNKDALGIAIVVSEYALSFSAVAIVAFQLIAFLARNRGELRLFDLAIAEVNHFDRFASRCLPN